MEEYNSVMERMTSGRGPREKLLDAALRILEEEGPQAVQARRVTGEIGASTMAVYTHFGGMPGLIDAMVREGLARFAAHVRARPPVEEPLADLFAGGLAYGEFALANPRLYSLMFGLAEAGRHPAAAETLTTAEGADALSVLLESVERVIEAGELPEQDARAAATQILSVTHGYLMLSIGGFVDEELAGVLEPLAVNLLVGLGADRNRAERALAVARESRIQMA
jgi:AcrR family transcriptional regulator